MAYSNFFPTGYTGYAYQPISAAYDGNQSFGLPNNQARTIQPQNGLNWVQGDAGAKAYPIAPNTTVALWDSEAQVIYLKSADASGMPSMKILDYSIREQQQPFSAQKTPHSADVYVTKEELNEFKDALEKRFKSLSAGGIDDE